MPLDGRTICNRICGVLTARGRSAEWDKAFEHISLHFAADLTKPSHTLFDKKYRSPEAIKDLIKRAASHPSSIKSTKLRIAGSPGEVMATKIVRHFAVQIGDTPALDCLLIIADEGGALVTAYPCTQAER